MNVAFADALYWVALTNPHDQWHKSAVKASRSLQGARLVTTEEVLTEFLNFVASGGAYLRRQANEAVHRMERNPSIEIIMQDHDSFQAGLNLFENRPDKGYS